jgi:hypothetical protein
MVGVNAGIALISSSRLIRNRLAVMKSLLALILNSYLPQVHVRIPLVRASHYLIPNRDEKFVSRSLRTGLVTECVSLVAWVSQCTVG